MTEPWNDVRVRAGLERQMRERAAMLASGDSHVGWKVGFGAPASLDLMEITAPLLGYLTSATVLSDAVVAKTDEWERGIVEFEVAVWMGSDLAAGADEEAARAAVASISPAIELANIDLPLAPSRVDDIVAGNIFHRGVIFGAQHPDRAGINIDGLTARVSIDGELQAETADLEAITGSYPWIVATVASTLSAVGERLRAGHVIITGSVVPPIPVSAGTEFTFTLDPMDPISVSVSGAGRVR